MISTTTIAFVLASISGAVAAVFERDRRERARIHLARLDAGEICIRCDGHDVTRTEDLIRCNACGFEASHARITAATVSETDFEAATAQSTSSTFIDGIDPDYRRRL